MLLFVHPVLGQQEASISNTRIEAVGERVHISFDIVGSSSMTFEVWVEVSDSRGNVIAAKTLNGDIGLQIKGGSNKLVTWDPATDGVFLDDDIYIQVKANFNVMPVRKEFTRGGLILQSLLVPGLGLSRYKGKPHWIKGVAAYGCLGGSLAFNQLAGESYRRYSESSDVGEASDLIETARMQEGVSKGLAYAAAAIWVTDLVWTVMGTSDLNAGLGAGFDPMLGMPVLRFTYSF